MTRCTSKDVTAGEFPLLLASRRIRHVFNSTCTNLSGSLRRTPYNPLAMNPADMSAAGVADGDDVLVSSAHGQVEAKVEADATLRRGVVTLPHGWGGLPGSGTGPGSAVNLLITCEADYEPIDGKREFRRTYAGLRGAGMKVSTSMEVDTYGADGDWSAWFGNIVREARWSSALRTGEQGALDRGMPSAWSIACGPGAAARGQCQSVAQMGCEASAASTRDRAAWRWRGAVAGAGSICPC